MNIKIIQQKKTALFIYQDFIILVNNTYRNTKENTNKIKIKLCQIEYKYAICKLLLNYCKIHVD